jgi:hypothetical protein
MIEIGFGDSAPHFQVVYTAGNRTVRCHLSKRSHDVNDLKGFVDS